MDARIITATTALIEKIGFDKALLVIAIFLLAALSWYVLKSNSKTIEKVRDELKTVKEDQAQCHKDREDCRIQLEKARVENKELMDTCQKSQVALIAATDANKQITSSFLAVIDKIKS